MRQTLLEPEPRMHSFSALLARRTRTCWSIGIILTIVLSARAGAQNAVTEDPRDSVKVALIRQLLDETHTVDLAVTAMESSVSAQRAANPRVPAVFWDRFLSLAKTRRDTLVSMFVDIYSRHFSSNDVRQMLDFYRSPIGRKMLAETAGIARESMLTGQAWGAQLGADVARELAKEGIQLP